MASLHSLLPSGLARSADLPTLPASTVVEIAGQAITWQRPPTAQGMLFLSLTDEDGLLNVVVPPLVRVRDGEATLRETLVLVRGVVERRDRSLSVRALALRPLAAVLVDGQPNWAVEAT